MRQGKRGEAGTEIVVRKPGRLLSSEIPKHWYGDQPFVTHFLDALSSTFPFGEAFFVRSVMHYRDRVADPKLADEIRDFAAQEGQHSRVHAEHVQLLLDQGYSLLGVLNGQADKVTRWMNRKHPRYALATTAALEHLTAILARQVLTHSETLTGPMHEKMATLWRWHALEEAEHKAVAFEVMRAAEVPHWMRVVSQLMSTWGLAFETLLRVAYMLYRDGLLFRRAGWRGGYRFLFGSAALLRGTGPAYRAWYRRDFHPDDEDDRALINQRSPEVAQELAALS